MTPTYLTVSRIGTDKCRTIRMPVFLCRILYFQGYGYSELTVIKYVQYCFISNSNGRVLNSL